jgi:hypothetical protein
MNDRLDNQEAVADFDRAKAAAYVAELSADLALIARRHGLDTLGYILDMAHLEAENVTRHVNGRR